MSSDLVGQVLAGKYRITAALGAGGMGAVFAAVQEPLDRPVAVKLLKDAGKSEVRGRFLREAKLLSKLSHARIVGVYDYGELADGTPFLVMERVKGRSLRDVLEERGRVPLGQLVRTLLGTCEGLAVAHDEGVAHLDLKPDNVMLLDDAAGEESVKILDFGIAKIVGGAGTDFTATDTGQVLGTPAYLSPEQIRGVRTDVRSDLYALGVMAYELITGKLPFDAATGAELVLHHMSTDPMPMAERAPGVEVPADLETWVRRLMSKEAEDRPADGREALAELRSIVDGTATQAGSASATVSATHESAAVATPAATTAAPATSTAAPALPARRVGLWAVLGVGLAFVALTGL
jgi:serine/threonine-protein kinase